MTRKPYGYADLVAAIGGWIDDADKRKRKSFWRNELEWIEIGVGSWQCVGTAKMSGLPVYAVVCMHSVMQAGGEGKYVPLVTWQVLFGGGSKGYAYGEFVGEGGLKVGGAMKPSDSDTPEEDEMLEKAVDAATIEFNKVVQTGAP